MDSREHSRPGNAVCRGAEAGGAQRDSWLVITALKMQWLGSRQG